VKPATSQRIHQPKEASMSIVALALAGIAVLSAAGLVAWVTLVMARADDDLRSFVERVPAFPDTTVAYYGISHTG
jgi:hypothetical protein